MRKQPKQSEDDSSRSTKSTCSTPRNDATNSDSPRGDRPLRSLFGLEKRYSTDTTISSSHCTQSSRHGTPRSHHGKPNFRSSISQVFRRHRSKDSINREPVAGPPDNQNSVPNYDEMSSMTSSSFWSECSSDDDIRELERRMRQLQRAMRQTNNSGMG